MFFVFHRGQCIQVQITEWKSLATKTSSLVYNYPGYENHAELFAFSLKQSENEKAIVKMISLVGNLYVTVSDEAMSLLKAFKQK